MSLDLPFPFTLSRLFRSPAISNVFPFPLGLPNSGVRLYYMRKKDDKEGNKKGSAQCEKIDKRGKEGEKVRSK